MLFSTSRLSQRLIVLRSHAGLSPVIFLKGFPRNSLSTRCFSFTPMTTDEEEKEKARVSHLSPEKKDYELRELNRQLARLERLRGINSGELYTWSGRYKALMRDYAFPLFMWYWCCWLTMGVGVYLAIDLGNMDAMVLISKADYYLSQMTGSHWALTEKVDPQLGKIGVALVANEMLEPIRLPLVVVTLKPTMDYLNPPKF